MLRILTCHEILTRLYITDIKLYVQKNLYFRDTSLFHVYIIYRDMNANRLLWDDYIDRIKTVGTFDISREIFLRK